MLQMVTYVMMSFVNYNKTTSLDDCLSKIARHFGNDSVALFYYQTERNGISYGSYEETVIDSFVRLQNWTLQIYNGKLTDSLSRYQINVRKSKIIVLIFSKEKTQFQIIEELNAFRSYGSWDSKAKIFIFTNGDKAPLLLKLLWKFARAWNVIVIANGIRYYSWIPYQENDCGDVRKIINLNDSDLYVNRNDGFANLHRCTVYVAAKYLAPYVIAPHERLIFVPLSLSTEIGGVETRIMETITKYLNGTMDYANTTYIISDHWVNYSPDGKPTGMLGTLKNCRADVAYSYLMISHERYVQLDCLTSHIEDEIVWIVPTPNPLAAAQSLLSAFDAVAWSLITTCLVAVVTLMRFESKEQFSACALKIFGAFLNMPIHTRVKFLPLLTYLSAMHLATAYQSWLLIHLMQEETEKPIKTAEDALERNLLFHLIPSLRQFYNEETPIFKKVLTPGRHVYTNSIFVSMEHIAIHKDGILLGPKLPGLYYIHKRKFDQKQKFKYLKPRFLQSKLTFYLTQGHPLTGDFDRKMNQIIESGLISYWLSNYARETEAGFKGIDAEGKKPLKLKNFRSAFTFLVIFKATSVAVFFIEVIWTWIRKKANERAKRKKKKPEMLKEFRIEISSEDYSGKRKKRHYLRPMRDHIKVA